MKLVLVTGMSGAGRSVALKMLEDCGFEAIDNLPLAFLSGVAQSSAARSLAVGIDSRARDFSAAHFAKGLAELRAMDGMECQVLFLDCDDEVLRRRFSETRRRHPLALDRAVADGIHQERALMEDVRARADLVIDTTDTSVAELRRIITASFGAEGRVFSLSVTSFSFKRGLPREADTVFDVRFLRNPFYVPELKELTGHDPRVAAHIQEDPAFEPFFVHCTTLLEPLLPKYFDEGKQYFTIAIGCTGGRHRSVFVAEKLAAFLSAKGYNVHIRHRDLDNA